MAEKKAKEAKKPAPEPETAQAATPVAVATEPKKGGLNLKLILIVVGAMVIGGAGAFGAMKFLSGSKAPAPEGAQVDEFSETVPVGESEEEPIVAPTKGEAPASGGHGAAHAEGAAEGTAIEGPQTVVLDPFTTNINDGTGRRFLKVSLSLEVADQAGADELKKMMPNIQDKILMLLSSQTMESISTLEGKERLRSQILREANTFMHASKISKVNYSQFIIQ
jgi:flagellar FliL protein